jgi:hypothetical protein
LESLAKALDVPVRDLFDFESYGSEILWFSTYLEYVGCWHHRRFLCACVKRFRALWPGCWVFSAGWLRVAAEGMTAFARHSGRARWVTSPILSGEDWQTLWGLEL